MTVASTSDLGPGLWLPPFPLPHGGSVPPPDGHLPPQLQGACPARASSLLLPAWARRVPVPRRVVPVLGVRGRGPQHRRRGARPQLYGNKGLVPPSAPLLTWV